MNPLSRWRAFPLLLRKGDDTDGRRRSGHGVRAHGLLRGLGLRGEHGGGLHVA